MDVLYGGHPKIYDFLRAFGLDADRVTDIEISGRGGELVVLKTGMTIKPPKEPYSRHFMFKLMPFDWTGCCVGCEHYGFGRYCILMNGFIRDDAWSFYCKSWSPSSRNMILYRRFVWEELWQKTG